jgi:hypothetical protein
MTEYKKGNGMYGGYKKTGKSKQDTLNEKLNENFEEEFKIMKEKHEKQGYIVKVYKTIPGEIIFGETDGGKSDIIKGDYVKYIIYKDGKYLFRTGGRVFNIGEKYFQLKPLGYGGRGTLFSVQFENVYVLLIKYTEGSRMIRLLEDKESKKNKDEYNEEDEEDKEIEEELDGGIVEETDKECEIELLGKDEGFYYGYSWNIFR